MSNSENIIQQENSQIKAQLLEYWIKVSKAINDDFEEILSFGTDSDLHDIISALFMIEEARQEQIKQDKGQLESLTQQVEQLKQEKTVLQEKNDELLKNENKSDNIAEIRSLELKINELSIALVQNKEEKILQMEQSQNEIQNLKAQQLELKTKIQQLEFEQQKKSSFVDSTDSRRNSKNHIEEDSSKLNSPSIQKLKLDYSKLTINQSIKTFRKQLEQVQGSSSASYRFGK